MSVWNSALVPSFSSHQVIDAAWSILFLTRLPSDHIALFGELPDYRLIFAREESLLNVGAICHQNFTGRNARSRLSIWHAANGTPVYARATSALSLSPTGRAAFRSLWSVDDREPAWQQAQRTKLCRVRKRDIGRVETDIQPKRQCHLREFLFLFFFAKLLITNKSAHTLQRKEKKLSNIWSVRFSLLHSYKSRDGLICICTTFDIVRGCCSNHKQAGW